VQEKFAARNITRSNYQGPTGIVGVLHDACRRAEMPAASVWAGTPYYLGGTPNPKTALGLLDALDDALGLALNLTEMRAVAEEFEKQVSAAVPENPELRERIEMLERRYDEQPQEFPPAGTIIADLENFLRKQRDDS
jgi:predicted ATP-grasp superfamily ATP-dependent carboligase